MTEEPIQTTELEPIQAGPNYEAFCLGEGKRQTTVYSSVPPEEPQGKVALQEWAKTVEIWVKKQEFEYAFGHLSNIQPGILSKERKIGEKDGFLVYGGLNLFEFANFIKRVRDYIGNKKDQGAPQTTQYYSAEKPEIWSKKKLPESLKEKLRIAGKKRRNKSFVPENYVNATWKH